jgi:hypothetical protein
MKPVLYCLVAATLCLAATRTAYAQGFPYDDFQPRTLKEIVKENMDVARDSGEPKSSTPTKHRIVIDADPLPSVIRVTYTGKTRPITDDHKKYLNLWIESFKKDSKFNNVYNQEMLVTEDSTSYWLLVHNALLPQFEKEIEQNKPVDLFLIRMGGELFENRAWDWLFLVEEFRKPGSENPAIFPWNDFERRSIADLIAINLKDDAPEAAAAAGARSKKRLSLRDNVLPSVVRATYTGKDRGIDPKRREFLEMWAATFSADENYAKLYDRELLFKENGIEHWIPAAKIILERFKHDIKAGSEVDLYLIRIGGSVDDGKADWVFLIEEFQKPRRQ